MYRPWSLVQLAAYLVEVDNHVHQTTLVHEFIRGYEETPLADRLALVNEEPGATGQSGWDAVVAALADHYANRDGFPPPAWVNDDGRMVHPPFAVVDTAGVRTMALVHSPAAFLRHGVLMMPEDLEPV